MKLSLYSLLALVIILISNNPVFSTHVRAGEIIAKRVLNSSLTYQISIIGYTDTGSSVIFGGGEIDFGDGTITNIEEGADFFSRDELIDAESQIAFNIFEIQHTFQAPGRYVIRFSEKNRNAGILNMSNSVDTQFYVETVLIIDPFLGMNNTPEFLVPPIDDGAVGKKFVHNPGAFDIDGDSLAFRLAIPKKDRDEDVSDYLDPNDPRFYSSNFSTGNEEQNGPPIFEINAITGELVWDAPGTLGEYSVAFIVEEWRMVSGEWFKLGYVTRDMQIIVEETDNNRPEISVPDDLCVVAGNFFSETVTGSDVDGQGVKLDAFGGPFELIEDPATFTPEGVFRSQPLQATIQWQTNCSDIRERPYVIHFKVTDNPDLGPRLVTFGRTGVRVMGPEITGLSAESGPSNTVNLNWNKYEDCGTSSKIQIWRKISSVLDDEFECNTNNPSHFGYSLVKELDSLVYVDQSVGQTKYRQSFTDETIAPGATYCYIARSKFPQPRGGFGIFSEEVCITTPREVSSITNVDVLSTSLNNGEISISWQAPSDLSSEIFTEPFSYQILRYEGLEPSGTGVNLGTTSSLNFVDSQIDTEQKVYSYVVRTFDSNSVLIGDSFPASTIELLAQPTTFSIQLEWDFDTPWSNLSLDYPYHRIYRDHLDPSDPTRLLLMDSVNVLIDGFTYIDDGAVSQMPLEQEVEYSYYVETLGTYGNSEENVPFINKSQVISVSPAEITSLDTYEESVFEVYPNPTENEVYISGNDRRDVLILINQTGQVLLENISNGLLDLSSIQPGMYILRNKTGTSKKLLVR